MLVAKKVNGKYLQILANAALKNKFFSSTSRHPQTYRSRYTTKNDELLVVDSRAALPVAHKGEGGKRGEMPTMQWYGFLSLTRWV